LDYPRFHNSKEESYSHESTEVLAAYFLNDKIGRLWSYRLAILVWASGILMQVFSSGIFGFLLFARIWGDLGAGGLTVIAPLFLSEIAPTKTRGMVVSMYVVVLMSFLSLGFFINYGVSKSMAQSRSQWQIVQAKPLIPVGIAFFGSFSIPRSPRSPTRNVSRRPLSSGGA
jgi:hypothetical protein